VTGTTGPIPPLAQSRQGNHLGAMYVLAALLLCAGGILVTLMMFVPTDWRGGGSDAYVPGTGASFEPLGRVAVLDEATLGTHEVAPGRFVVNIAAFNWAFRPNEIRIPVGAEVTFHATSVDDYHGIALIGTDVVLSLKQYVASEATHTFTEPGEYVFMCSEYCGAGHTGMTGRVIVE